MIILRLILLEIIIAVFFIKISYSLRCRTDDGPSDGELKRVARSCMRKFGDNVFVQSSQQQQQQQQQMQQHHQSQGRYGPRLLTLRENHNYNYEDSEESDIYDFGDGHYYNSNNKNYNRQQHNNNNNNHNDNNNERRGYGGNNNNNNGGHNDERQRNRYNNNNRTANNRENNNSNSNSNSNSNNNVNHKVSKHNNNNFNNNNNNNQNNSFSDVACIVHCFFAEMHMVYGLNNDDYPDRHKMLYILTKEMRHRELRNFYTDTIQECFRYLENQRRRDKCQFSRDLITCMTEYAKGNCDDWNEFNMMFN